MKQIWRALITWFFEISLFLKNELNYLIFYSLFWPMHFVSFTYLINFFFVLLPLYLSFLFLGLLIHFFRHCKLEKFKIRAILKMIVRDHSFMILAKNIKKLELPSPYPEPSNFGLSQKSTCTIIMGLTFIKKLTLLWEFFLILGFFFVTKTTLKFFLLVFYIPYSRCLHPIGHSFFVQFRKQIWTISKINSWVYIS